MDRGKEKGKYRNTDSWNKSFAQSHPFSATDKSGTDMFSSWAPFPEVPHINTSGEYGHKTVIKTTKVEEVCKSETWRLSEHCAIGTCFFLTHQSHRLCWDLSHGSVPLTRADSPKHITSPQPNTTKECGAPWKKSWLKQSTDIFV